MHGFFNICYWCTILTLKDKNNMIISIDAEKAFDCVDHNKLWKIRKEMGNPWTISQNSPGLVFLAVPVTSHLCATSVLSSASYIAAWLMLQNADFFLLPCTYACVLRCVLLFWNPMDCSPPGSSVSGILQARILEWVVIPFSRGSSLPKDQSQVSHTAVRFFTIWATKEGHILLYLNLKKCFDKWISI